MTFDSSELFLQVDLPSYISAAVSIQPEEAKGQAQNATSERMAPTAANALLCSTEGPTTLHRQLQPTPETAEPDLLQLDAAPAMHTEGTNSPHSQCSSPKHAETNTCCLHAAPVPNLDRALTAHHPYAAPSELSDELQRRLGRTDAAKRSLGMTKEAHQSIDMTGNMLHSSGVELLMPENAESMAPVSEAIAAAGAFSKGIQEATATVYEGQHSGNDMQEDAIRECELEPDHRQLSQVSTAKLSLRQQSFQRQSWS